MPLPTDPAATGPHEVSRLVLCDDDVRRIIRHEIDDRVDTIEQFTRAGQPEAADDIRAEITILEHYLAD